MDKKKLVLQKNAKTLKSFSSFDEEINSAKDAQKQGVEDEQDETEKDEKKDKKRKLPIETPGQPKIASVDTWTQGPENANQIHTQRKFNIKTPGQVRDYAKFVDDRKFQKFEEVDLEESLRGTLSDKQLANLKKVWAKKTKRDVTPAIKKLLKNLDAPTRAAIANAKINVISKMVPEEVDLDEAKVKIRNTGKSLENKVMMIVKSDNLNISLSKSMDMRDIIADGNPRDIRILQKKLKEEVDIEEKGLWHNIHMKRKRGETMRKKGEKGAPTPQQMARAKAASEDPEVRQDPDVKDKKGTQPAKYFSGIKSKSTKSARDTHFKKGAKMDDDNPAAYKPAPGDATGKTKPSKHTIAFKKKFGEDVQQEIKDIKAWSELDETIELDQTVSEMFDELLSENEGVKKKAAKSGMPYGVLMKVYNRGMAAWRTGHRPGTTPQQWGMARVNSFVTKSSGTWGKADSDLAAKVRGK